MRRRGFRGPALVRREGGGVGQERWLKRSRSDRRSVVVVPPGGRPRGARPGTQATTVVGSSPDAGRRSLGTRRSAEI
ncbi:uncharacterized protein M6B38_398780 [Iris pallida]|uniref:Uncharacterized protein n=1 Tax=Iris pallida TaxID=29817 RepID=A0AAX6FVI8_IRIPA|nr:uncharacterized protein M6B38_398780 [Iris pallida]